MRKISSKLAGQQSGFTLIELVIVIVIIGILAAVAIPNFSTVTSQAKLAKCDAIVGSLKSAYAIAIATSGGAAPTRSQVLAQQTDPTCSNANPSACVGIGTFNLPDSVGSSTQISISTCASA